MAKFALIFSVVLVLVLVSVLVESAPQGSSPYFNMFNWLYQGVNRSGRPAAGGPRRGGGGRNNYRFRSRYSTNGRSRTRTSDDGKGKYWNGYDKDGYGRNGRDVSHVLSAAAHNVLTSNSPEANFMRR